MPPDNDFQQPTPEALRAAQKAAASERRHGYASQLAEAAREIERLRAKLDDIEMHGLDGIMLGYVCVCVTEWEQVYGKQS